MFNPTVERFGYPATLVREYRYWLVLLRPAQVTAGSLVLAAKSEATAFADLPAGAFTELGTAVAEIEATLRRAVDYERINYLMLMMVDPNVHFHVVPRYAGERSLAGIPWPDVGWPGPPDLKSAAALTETQIGEARDALAAAWVARQN